MSLQKSVIKEIFLEKPVDQTLLVKGWVKSLRKSKKFCFIVINDGSSLNSLQVIADQEIDNYDKISSMRTGFAVSITGKIVSSGGKNQGIEMHATKVSILGDAPEDYPLQKKKTSLEYLREIAHLRPRTNTFGAVFRVRNALNFATHKFFVDRGYVQLHSPIITGSDCEGAGEMFQVSTLNPNQLKKTDSGETDYSVDYFGKQSNLTVSGQLNAEAFALALGKVYTFGPTFRAENSNTTRHLAEFWMVEPEVAFADLKEIAKLATDYLKYLIQAALDNCQEDLQFLQSTYKENLIEDLVHTKESEFINVSYTEAIKILEKASSTEKFEFKPEWGQDLQTEHERFLCEKHFKLPVIVF